MGNSYAIYVAAVNNNKYYNNYICSTRVFLKAFFVALWLKRKCGHVEVHID